VSADLAHDARLRRLHVADVHRTWGVALGFDATTDGTRAVVEPGLAYDRYAREILSAATVGLPLPAPPAGSAAAGWWFDLAVRYAELPRGAAERPDWRWYFAGEDTGGATVPPARELRPGEDVPLARFRLSAGGSVTGPDFSLRQTAHGLVRPHIAAARVPAGGVGLDAGAIAAAWQITIDTSAGGFSTDPFYVVSLADHPLAPGSLFAALFATDAARTAALRRLLGPFVAIVGSNANTLRVEVRLAASEGEAIPAELARATGLVLPVPVDWLGFEPVTGCPPDPPILRPPLIGPGHTV
jgi:hypothetical protein